MNGSILYVGNNAKSNMESRMHLYYAEPDAVEIASEDVTKEVEAMIKDGSSIDDALYSYHLGPKSPKFLREKMGKVFYTKGKIAKVVRFYNKNSEFEFIKSIEDPFVVERDCILDVLEKYGCVVIGNKMHDMGTSKDVVVNEWRGFLSEKLGKLRGNSFRCTEFRVRF